TGHDAIAPLPLEESEREGSETRVVFGLDGRRWEVRVHTERGEPRRLTCRAVRQSAGMSHRLVAVTDL
ncbi:MAG TPA: hypothetical protein VLA97_06080, partial [Nocardioidaceae bacterium]|nr:hypothetical protein [Nocardioidaceae bacterium]